MSIIIDTETTGLPTTFNYKYLPYTDILGYNSSRIVQISWIIPLKNNNLQRTFIIKPSDFIIHPSNYHYITQELSNEKGIKLEEIVDIFYKDITDYNIKNFLAYNVEFDYNILLSELFRIKRDDVINSILSMNTICIMKLAQSFLKLKKYPKLEEAYNKIVNDTNDTKFHDAEFDTLAAYKVWNCIKIYQFHI